MAEPRRRVYRKRTFLDADMGLRETRLFVWHMAGLENFLESQPGNTRAWVADTEVFVRALAHFEVGIRKDALPGPRRAQVERLGDALVALHIRPSLDEPGDALRTWAQFGLRNQ